MGCTVEHVNNESTNNKLLDTWVLWSHLPHDTNWDLDSYKEITKITNMNEAINLYENLPEIIIKNCMLFLVRDGIKPTWEDPKNHDGGSFSFKINNKCVVDSWKNLSYVLLGETLTSPELSEIITGISISPKKNFCIIKIWLSNCNNTDPDILVEIDVFVKNGCLFKKHINPEN